VRKNLERTPHILLILPNTNLDITGKKWYPRGGQGGGGECKKNPTNFNPLGYQSDFDCDNNLLDQLSGTLIRIFGNDV